LVEVVVPVFGEVAVAVEGSEFENRFGAGSPQRPTGDEVELALEWWRVPYAA
jgi:hypothetical protein